MAKINLSSMSVDALLQLRDDVAASSVARPMSCNSNLPRSWKTSAGAVIVMAKSARSRTERSPLNIAIPKTGQRLGQGAARCPGGWPPK